MCKAQVVYPLNTFYDDIPKGSYIKDINNDLDSFIGLWKVNYDQKEILISVKKIIKKNIARKHGFKPWEILFRKFLL